MFPLDSPYFGAPLPCSRQTVAAGVWSRSELFVTDVSTLVPLELLAVKDATWLVKPSGFVSSDFWPSMTSLVCKQLTGRRSEQVSVCSASNKSWTKKLLSAVISSVVSFSSSLKLWSFNLDWKRLIIIILIIIIIISHLNKCTFT